MKRVALVGAFFVSVLWILFLKKPFKPDPYGSVAPVVSEDKKRETFSPVQSRGKGSVLVYGANLSGSGMLIPSEAVVDGEWILSFPFVEPQMVMWAFTNAGVSVDQAKARMRTTMRHLYVGVFYKERISQSEVKEIEELKSIRENDTYSDRDKIGFMIVKAAAYQVTRERWITERDEWMKEFTDWVDSLGVSDPAALKKDLLLIQPANPPPDPKPPE